ncbi:hypothetical protein K504DRAFT_462168 [Pleomassaria siparia CBS 279.74]|uniref:Uncharacterized protein n=1 Tax=Pleomassaria siparia CBS 279.74 TaxID=1314801 RepID=A0A6G1KMV8_9PLEO|nr:hypothetical protein K504DRAFT_462168 [Pleomassaria siparia CBS 279.74]
MRLMIAANITSTLALWRVITSEIRSLGPQSRTAREKCHAAAAASVTSILTASGPVAQWPIGAALERQGWH